MWIKEEIRTLVRTQDIFEKRNGIFCLDRNERTMDFTDSIIAQIRERIDSGLLTKYPEIGTLYAKMARYLGNNVTVDNLIFHSGSDLVIKSIYETYISGRGENKVLLQKPAYAMYSVYAEMFQAEIIFQTYQKGWKFDIDEYKNKILKYKPKLVVLENPNGSIGNCYSHQTVEKLIKTAAQVDSLIVVDEAYIDFCGGSVIDLIGKYENLIVVRTLSKAWGMAGLRIGYAVACRERINELFQVRPMHQLTSFSIMAAEILLDHEEEIDAYVREMQEVREYVKKALRDRKIEITDSVTHFVTAELGKVVNVDRLREYLSKYGYEVRRPFDLPELNCWVRIGLLPMEQMKNFMNLLDVFLENNRIQ